MNERGGRKLNRRIILQYQVTVSQKEPLGAPSPERVPKWTQLSTRLLGRGCAGPFYPRPVLAFGYCHCLRVCVCVRVRVSVNHEFVRAITHQPFKLGSPKLDQICKRPWLRAPLFCGMIDHDLRGQIELQSQNFSQFELVHAITHHQFKLQFPNLEQKCSGHVIKQTKWRSLTAVGILPVSG